MNSAPLNVLDSQMQTSSAPSLGLEMRSTDDAFFMALDQQFSLDDQFNIESDPFKWFDWS
jgi:hypothetical protein